jgi:glutaminase
MSNSDLIAEVFKKVLKIDNEGELASYIPELALVNSNKFGVHISTTSNFNFGLGDFSEKFFVYP